PKNKKGETMTKDAAHTPAPLSFETQYVSAERKQTTGRFIVRDRENNYLFEVEGEANAEFIVNACNSHLAMLTALEWQAMAEADPQASRRKGYFDRAREARKSAIAKTKGGAA